MSILVIATFLIAALSATYAFAAETAGSSVNVTAVVMFLVFVGATLGITYWAARKTKTAADFYSAGGGLTDYEILAVVCHERYALGGADPTGEYSAEFTEWCSESSEIFADLEAGGDLATLNERFDGILPIGDAPVAGSAATS